MGENWVKSIKRLDKSKEFLKDENVYTKLLNLFKKMEDNWWRLILTKEKTGSCKQKSSNV